MVFPNFTNKMGRKNEIDDQVMVVEQYPHKNSRHGDVINQKSPFRSQGSTHRMTLVVPGLASFGRVMAWGLLVGTRFKSLMLRTIMEKAKFKRIELQHPKRKRIHHYTSVII